VEFESSVTAEASDVIVTDRVASLEFIRSVSLLIVAGITDDVINRPDGVESWTMGMSVSFDAELTPC